MSFRVNVIVPLDALVVNSRDNNIIVPAEISSSVGNLRAVPLTAKGDNLFVHPYETAIDH